MSDDFSESTQEHIVSPQISPDFESESIKFQLSVEELLNRIKKRLLREKYDLKEKDWVKGKEPLMNEEGVDCIMALLESMLDKNLFLTELKDSHINRIMIDILDDLTDIIMIKYKEFDIDPAHRSTVINMIEHPLYFALCRAGKGLTLRSLQKSHTVRETVVKQGRRPFDLGLLSRK